MNLIDIGEFNGRRLNTDLIRLWIIELGRGSYAYARIARYLGGSWASCMTVRIQCWHKTVGLHHKSNLRG